MVRSEKHLFQLHWTTNPASTPMKPRGLVRKSINSCFNLLRRRHFPLATSCNQPSSCPILAADYLEMLHHLISSHVPPCQNEILTLFSAFQINLFHFLFIFVVITMCVSVNSVWLLYFIDHLGAFWNICCHRLHLSTRWSYRILLFHYPFPTVAFTDFEIAMFEQGSPVFILLCAYSNIYTIYQMLLNYLP